MQNTDGWLEPFSALLCFALLCFASHDTSFKQTSVEQLPALIRTERESLLPLQSVASISAGNDSAIGALISDALEKVGADGVLSIETSNSLETTVEVQEGMQIDRGYASPQFITNQVRSHREHSPYSLY
jgi:chaperonin GroEL (HSP60 family)